MKESFESSKDDFDGWVSKWEKAVKDGVFGDAPKLPSTGDATSDFSFFGLRQDNPSAEIRDSDAAYWNAINSVADGGVEMERLDEGEDNDPANPVRLWTKGKDQELEPYQTGQTFDEKDIEDLASMKVKLHDVGSKSAEMSDNDYSSQIDAMIKKIDDLSDRMCRPKKN
jgi:hypothetical protein